MSKRKKITILICILVTMALIFAALFYYVMTFEPQAEQEYATNRDIAMAEVVLPEGDNDGTTSTKDSICKNGEIKQDVTHSIPEYSYNDVIGSLTFVASDFEVPILYGNPAEDFMTAMDSGGGYDPNSSYPGGETTTVIAGHKNQDFAQLQYVEVGDALVLNIDGNVYTYEVTDTKVVEDTDVSSVYHDGNELVIYTCYPFYHQDFYSQRYVVTASPVSQVSC